MVIVGNSLKVCWKGRGFEIVHFCCEDFDFIGSMKKKKKPKSIGEFGFGLHSVQELIDVVLGIHDKKNSCVNRQD